MNICWKSVSKILGPVLKIHHKKYEEGLKNSFQKQYDREKHNFLIGRVYVDQHKLQDFAALFSSQPDKLAAYLTQRHEDDYAAKSKWCKDHKLTETYVCVVS